VVEDLLPVPLELDRTHAGHAAQRGERHRAGIRDRAKRRIVGDDVGGDSIIPGPAAPPRPERLERRGGSIVGGSLPGKRIAQFDNPMATVAPTVALGDCPSPRKTRRD
jgi:hypothetical protein